MNDNNAEDWINVTADYDTLDNGQYCSAANGTANTSGTTSVEYTGGKDRIIAAAWV